MPSTILVCRGESDKLPKSSPDWLKEWFIATSNVETLKPEQWASWLKGVRESSCEARIGYFLSVAVNLTSRKLGINLAMLPSPSGKNPYLTIYITPNRHWLYVDGHELDLNIGKHKKGMFISTDKELVRLTKVLLISN